MGCGTKVTQDYLVLDGVYYWHYEETPMTEKTVRNRLFILLEEGKQLVLLIKPMEGHYEYHFYERDSNDEGPEDDLE